MTSATPPLRIGPVQVDPPVVLAPMAGVTNGAFRSLCRRFGAGLYVSEMVSARGLVQGHRRTVEMASSVTSEPVRSIQLQGIDPAVVGGAVRILVDDLGADHVDLNFGCPAEKVTRRGGGAALPARSHLLGQIVAAAVDAAGPVPVTIKIRTGVDATTSTFLEAGRVAAEAGIAAVALHARTAEQRYSGHADWSAIAALKQAVPHVPVLGNGDIWEARDALAMMQATGCDGVVVGRGCLGRPWLFAQLAAAFTGRPVPPQPTLGSVLEVMVDHAQLLVQELGPQIGIRSFRKHVGWYLESYGVDASALERLRRMASLDELRTVVSDLDPAGAMLAEAVRRPRGHTHGPKSVALPPGWLDPSGQAARPGAEPLMAVSGG